MPGVGKIGPASGAERKRGCARSNKRSKIRTASTGSAGKMSLYGIPDPGGQRSKPAGKIFIGLQKSLPCKRSYPAGAIVGSPGASIPGIEMGGENDVFIRLFTSPDLRDGVTGRHYPSFL